MTAKRWVWMLAAGQWISCEEWRESRCDSTSKDVTVWCPDTRLCLDAGHDPEVECPEDAVTAEECDAFNDVFAATEKGQVWGWNEDTQTCEDGS